MKMRFGLGVLAYLVPTFALGFIWHLMLFESYYEHLAIYRKDIIIPFGFLSMLVQAFVFAWIYQHGFASGAGVWCRVDSYIQRSALYSRGVLRRWPSRPRT